MSTPEQRLKNAMKRDLSGGSSYNTHKGKNHTNSTPEQKLRESLHRDLRHERARESERAGELLFSQARQARQLGQLGQLGQFGQFGGSSTPVIVNSPIGSTGMVQVQPGASVIPVAGGGIAVINGSTYGVPNVQIIGGPGIDPSKLMYPGRAGYWTPR